MKVYAEWEQRADDATGVPRYTYGNGVQAGAGDTASGLAMLMNNAAKGLMSVICTVPLSTARRLSAPITPWIIQALPLFRRTARWKE